MSYSFTATDSVTFSHTHAQHIAAKVSADLKRLQRFYGQPSDGDIALYEAEIIVFLKAGYLGTVTYGFWKSGNWIEPALRYRALDLAGASANDDDPGRVSASADISGASFYSYLTFSDAWDKATAAEKAAFESLRPFSRGGAPAPGISGYLSEDKTYSAGGRAMARSTIRSY